MEFIVINQTSHRVPRKMISALSLKLVRELKSYGFNLPKNMQIPIVFVGESQGRKLNFKFRKKNYATDVLSFGSISIDKIAKKKNIFADENDAELVICFDVIQKNAVEHNLTTQQELGYMLIHGVLHLLGLDHEKSKKEAQKMFKIQDAIFEKLFIN